MVRGFSFITESHAARRTMRASQTARFDWFDLLIGLESLTCVEQQVFQYRTETQRREECQSTYDDNHAHQQHGEQRCCHWKGPGRWRHGLFACEIPGNREHWNDHEEAANQRVEPQGRVVPG